jgi:hypothetical protein
MAYHPQVVSSLSVPATITAFLWSIRRPTFVFLDVPLCPSFSPAAQRLLGIYPSSRSTSTITNDSPIMPLGT